MTIRPLLRRGAGLAGAVAVALLTITPTASSAADKASAKLLNPEGTEIGLVQVRETPHGVIITLGATRLPPGSHGFHVHETGDCGGESGDFGASGGHFAPDGKAHGFLHEDGPHAGDLPNIFVHGDSTVSAEVYSDRLSISGAENRATLLDEDGAAFVIHANADDYESQPSGAGGDRVACGVIEAAD